MERASQAFAMSFPNATARDLDESVLESLATTPNGTYAMTAMDVIQDTPLPRRNSEVSLLSMSFNSDLCSPSQPRTPSGPVDVWHLQTTKLETTPTSVQDAAAISEHHRALLSQTFSSQDTDQSGMSSWYNNMTANYGQAEYDLPTLPTTTCGSFMTLYQQADQDYLGSDPQSSFSSSFSGDSWDNVPLANNCTIVQPDAMHLTPPDFLRLPGQSDGLGGPMDIKLESPTPDLIHPIKSGDHYKPIPITRPSRKLTRRMHSMRLNTHPATTIPSIPTLISTSNPLHTFHQPTFQAQHPKPSILRPQACITKTCAKAKFQCREYLTDSNGNRSRCERRFARSEHQHRHEKSHRTTPAEQRVHCNLAECKYSILQGKYFLNNRKDNLNEHIVKTHLTHTPSGRNIRVSDEQAVKLGWGALLPDRDRHDQEKKVAEILDIKKDDPTRPMRVRQKVAFEYLDRAEKVLIREAKLVQMGLESGYMEMLRHKLPAVPGPTRPRKGEGKVGNGVKRNGSGRSSAGRVTKVRASGD